MTGQTIAANAAAGNVDKYGLGGVKAVEITVNGQAYSVDMELVAKNFDKLTETSADYNSGATTASFTFLAKDVLPFKRYMNATSGVNDYARVANDRHLHGNGRRHGKCH